MRSISRRLDLEGAIAAEVGVALVVGEDDDGRWAGRFAAVPGAPKREQLWRGAIQAAAMMAAVVHGGVILRTSMQGASAGSVIPATNAPTHRPLSGDHDDEIGRLPAQSRRRFARTKLPPPTPVGGAPRGTFKRVLKVLAITIGFVCGCRAGKSRGASGNALGTPIVPIVGKFSVSWSAWQLLLGRRPVDAHYEGFGRMGRGACATVRGHKSRRTLVKTQGAPPFVCTPITSTTSDLVARPASHAHGAGHQRVAKARGRAGGGGGRKGSRLRVARLGVTVQTQYADETGEDSSPARAEQYEQFPRRRDLARKFPLYDPRRCAPRNARSRHLGSREALVRAQARARERAHRVGAVPAPPAVTAHALGARRRAFTAPSRWSR